MPPFSTGMAAPGLDSRSAVPPLLLEADCSASSTASAMLPAPAVRPRSRCIGISSARRGRRWHPLRSRDRARVDSPNRGLRPIDPLSTPRAASRSAGSGNFSRLFGSFQPAQPPCKNSPESGSNSPLRIDARRPLRSTVISRGLPRPAPAGAREALQSLPALDVPVLNRRHDHRTRGGGPRLLPTKPVATSLRPCQRSHAGRTRCAVRLSSTWCGTRGRPPAPAIPSSTRSTQRAAVLAPQGLPARPPRQLDTALDFRSGVDPCERMALRHRTDPPEDAEA